MTESSESEFRRDVNVWEAFLRVHAAVVPVISKEVEDANRLPLSWYDVLLELYRAPQHRLQMSELGRLVVLSRSRVSRIVDEMVEEGLVTKTADPDDRRSIFAVITANGRRAFRRTAPVYLDAINRHFLSHLEPGEVETMNVALGRIAKVYGSAGRERLPTSSEHH